MPKVGHSAPPLRLAVSNPTCDLLCGRFPVWHAFPLTSHSRRQTQTALMCVMRFLQNCLCFELLTTQKKTHHPTTTMQLQPNCSAEIPTSVVDPDKAAFNMNQFCRVQTRDISCVRSGGSVGPSRWHGACYLSSNV